MANLPTLPTLPQQFLGWWVFNQLFVLVLGNIQLGWIQVNRSGEGGAAEDHEG